jgi:dTDP-4-amino-4,6-dideoxygalactose transaminase
MFILGGEVETLERELAEYTGAEEAVGSEYPSRNGAGKSCTFGDLGTLSFFPSKNLGGFGDGGMVITNRSSLR